MISLNIVNNNGIVVVRVNTSNYLVVFQKNLGKKTGLKNENLISWYCTLGQNQGAHFVCTSQLSPLILSSIAPVII